MIFRDWLETEMGRQGISKRELARRLADRHPKGITPVTVETYRRAVRRYLEAENPQRPTEATRQAIADALGLDRDQIPEDEDEDEDDLLAVALLRECQRRIRRGHMDPRTSKWIRWGVRNGVFAELEAKGPRKEIAA